MLYTLITLFFILTIYSIFQMYEIIKYKNLTKNGMNYVASLTHDLKSPTNAQINMLNLLMQGYFGKLNPEQYEMIKLTCGSTKYISNLVTNVLSDYKCNSKNITLNKTKFNIISLTKSIIKRYEFILSDKKMSIIFNHQPEICEIYGDKLQIERVISNILSNAVNYGFSKTTIFINIEYNKNIINFSISNKSNHISDSDIKNIFHKFSKTSNSKYNSYSTGLGLYTAKKIIDMHRGEIYAKSFKDGTCTFGFFLKYKENDKKSILFKNKCKK